MSYEFGNIHQLHLLNFNPSNNISDEEKNKIFENSYANDTNENLKSQRYNCSSKRVVKEFAKVQSISDTSLRIQRRSSRANNAIRCILRKSPFSHLKKGTTRLVSLNDIKQKLSSSSLVFSDKLKCTIQSVKSQTFLKHRRKGKHKVYQSNSGNNDNFQVLFTSEKYKKNFKDRNICGDCKKLDLLFDSKSSGDLFGFNANNPNVCYQLFKYPCRKHPPTVNYEPNLYCQDDEYFRKHQINGVKNYRKSGSYGYTVPVHYNLVDFPCSNNQTWCVEPTIRKTCVHKASTVDTCPCINEQVSVTPSCFPMIRRKGAGDSGVVPHNIITSDECKTNISEQPKCIDFTKPHFSLLTFDLPKNPVTLGKTTLKYILFGIAIIVWSPCIIVVGLYWLITYPLRPQHVFRDDKNETGNKCGSCFECGHNFIHYIFHKFVRVAKKVFYSYNALYYLLKKKKNESSQCIRSCLPKTFSDRQLSCKKRRLYPNPKNKYMLYYTRHRGWKMKPLRKRRKSLSKYCECHQTDFRKAKDDKSKDKECECYTDEVQNKTDKSHGSKLPSSRKFSIAKSIKRRKSRSNNIETSKKISTKSSPIQTNVEEKPSQNLSVNQIPTPLKKSRTPTQKLVPGALSHEKKDRDSSPIRELHSRKAHPKLPPSIRTPENEINKFSTLKATKSVSFKGNIPKYVDTNEPYTKKVIPPHMRQRIPLHPRAPNQMGRMPMGSSTKIKRDKIPCPCSYKTILQKSNRPIVCIQKDRPIKINYKKYESKGQSRKRRICCWCKSIRKNFGHIIKDVEGQAWKCDICDDMFVYTLKRRPWFWIYSYCPSFYPYFLIFYKFYENVVYAIMYIVTTCIWCPILCWCYFCYTLFCRCIC